MQIKKYAMPIFLLYMISSSIFLGLFLNLYYETSIRRIEFQNVSQIIEIINELRMKFRYNSYLDINDFKDLGDIKANVLDNSSKKFIVRNFGDINFDNAREIPSPTKNKELEYKVKIYEDNLYLSAKFYYSRRHHMMGMGSGMHMGRMDNQNIAYSMVFQSLSFKNDKEKLILNIIMIFAIAFISFVLISYFIIRLSLRALFDKINSLDSFITDTTHEINTPLSVILMSIEVFDKDPKKYLQNIKIASKTLSNLYNDLVLLKLKNYPNKIERVNLKNLINERIFYFDLNIKQKNIRLTQNLDNTIIDTDRSKLEKIFDNLLVNAIKYSPDNGEVLVLLNNGILSITNQGSINSKDIDKIFDKFSRFNDQNGGFGIGLSLVKRFVQELGFDIKCTSENNSITFSINFKNLK